MKISLSAKAIFFILNHVAAFHVPPHLKVAARLQERSGENASPTTATEPFDGTPTENNLIPRASTSASSCPACRDWCPSNKIISPKNCKKCIKCPAGMKADPTFKTCIKDDGKKNNDDDDNEKKKKWEEKLAKWSEKQKKLRAPFKEKKWGEKKQKLMDEYKKNEDRKKDNEKRKKVRRFGRCLPIVALAMGPGVAATYADEFWDEDWLESMELLELEPEGYTIEPWDSEDSDKIFEEDDYLNKWIDYGNKQAEARSIRSYGAMSSPLELTPRDPTPTPTLAPVLPRLPPREGPASTGLVLYEDHEKRFFWLIPIFAAIASTVARVAVGAARAAGAALRLSKYTMKIAKGAKSKKSRLEQKEGAKKVAKDKNWKQCLHRMGPL
ncbi:hypothetical protein BJ875DRAFT_494710 [Amylocarpus encephaloides]|uniref:TNFR-Cys domain-containing protein n=1 Tax=Amylocarpus encephaloides TaxID=45428 RepID=A0A9P7YMG2_9HELO|nr:hypothetical protein BJ875DRAFT_494710 [Amylocarpus encephaloides]